MSRRSKQQPEEAAGWKGAFADFCMSMMTLFMVLWIVAIADQQQRESLSLYFSDPGTFDTVNSRYVIEQVTNGLVVRMDSSSGKTIVDRPDPITNEIRGGDPYEVQLMELSDKNENVNVKKIPGGLLIELVETKEQPMFLRSEYQLTPFFEDLLLELAPKLVSSGGELAIIGHTDSTPYTGHGSFENNWSLSYARANSVRELMDFVGMSKKNIVQVSGMADSQPLDKKNPRSAINRRVELVLIDKVKGIKNRMPEADNNIFTVMDGARYLAEKNQI